MQNKKTSSITKSSRPKSTGYDTPTEAVKFTISYFKRLMKQTKDIDIKTHFKAKIEALQAVLYVVKEVEALGGIEEVKEKINAINEQPTLF
jgi:hypothetical protein